MHCFHSNTCTPTNALVNTESRKAESSMDYNLIYNLEILLIIFCRIIEIPSKYIALKDCAQSEFFDIQTFACKACPENSTSSSNQLQCINNDAVFTTDCISCQNSVCYRRNPVEGDFNDTFSANFTCHPCPSNYFVSLDRTECIPCLDTITEHYESLPAYFQAQIQEFCIPENFSTFWSNEIDRYSIKYRDQTVNSHYFQHEMTLAIYSCQLGNSVACKHLGNMCSLTLKPESFPCKMLQDISKNASQVFYAVNNTQIALENKSLPFSYPVNTNLEFITAKYSLRGKLLSISNWIPPCSGFESIRFGVNTSKSCVFFIRDVLDMKIEFLSVYLSYLKAEDQSKMLYELPILIKTEDTDMSNISTWKLIRNYFTMDTITNFGTFPTLNHTKSSEKKIIRFIKSLTLQIKLQGRKAPGKIFPPLIIIEYDQLSENQIFPSMTAVVDYKIAFVLDKVEVAGAIEIVIGCCVGLVIIYAAFKSWLYTKKSGSSFLSIRTVLWFTIYSLGSIGNIFLLMSSCISIYLLILYKGQTVLHVILPDNGVENIIKVATMIVFGVKIGEILSLMYYQRGINIFFIDWEQPRRNLSASNYDSPHTSLKKSYKQRFRRESMDSERKNSGSNQNDISSVSSQHSGLNWRKKNQNLPETRENWIYSLNDSENEGLTAPISIWRTYFVANEWLRLKTKRKTSILLQILTILFFLEIVGVKNWALGVPEWSLQSSGSLIEENFTFKYAVGAATYMIIYSFQWILSTLYEKYVKNRLQEFVDLCSVANISVFILSDDHWGHYIHGRSVHGFTDTDLLTLISDLTREENNFCARRGLIPGTTHQMFVISVSKSFKSSYDALIDDEKTSKKRLFNRDEIKLDTWKNRWQVHLNLQKFLSCFLDHCLKNMDYFVKEKYFLTKLFNIELKKNPEESIFYIDHDYSFGEVIFYGNEWILSTFDITTFLLSLSLGFNYTFSGILSIFLSKTVSYIAEFDQNENLAKKTLIDRRFLM